jgi:hypothetical protein
MGLSILSRLLRTEVSHDLHHLCEHTLKWSDMAGGVPGPRPAGAAGHRIAPCGTPSPSCPLSRRVPLTQAALPHLWRSHHPYSLEVPTLLWFCLLCWCLLVSSG